MVLNDRDMEFRRLNLLNHIKLTEELKANIKKGFYNDYHFMRPFKKYNDLNNEVINCLAETQNNFLFITEVKL